MGWICLSLGVGMFLWGSPSRSALTAADRVTVPGIAQTNPTSTPFRNPTATPPTQGGHGHDLFYIYCMPCHGDRGQGLTDEFRSRQYPPEDTNCWKSGCHGNRPYDNGFTLPKTVPVLIGANTLTKFATARNMFDFMRTAMPFNKPGSLSQEQYLQLLAFLLEQNNLVPAGVQLAPDSLQQIALRPKQMPTSPASAADAQPDGSASVVIGIILLLGIVVLAVLIILRRSRRASH
jgi:mono/diheme cytochrome c family protein